MRDAVRTAHSIAYIVHTSIRLNINTSYKYISSRYIRYVIVRQILQPQYPCISAARVCQTTITLIYTIIRHSLTVGPHFWCSGRILVLHYGIVIHVPVLSQRTFWLENIHISASARLLCLSISLKRQICMSARARSQKNLLRR